MKKRIQRRIEELREQPEHVRYRAASYITVVSGIVLVVLWLAVLLPTQLHLQNRDNGEGASEEGIFNQARERFSSFSPLPQVGGVSDTEPSSSAVFSPLPSPSSTPVESFSPTSTHAEDFTPSPFISPSSTPTALLPSP